MPKINPTPEDESNDEGKSKDAKKNDNKDETPKKPQEMDSARLKKLFDESKARPMKGFRPPEGSRLTLILTAHHSRNGSQPTTTDVRYGKTLTEDEDTYRRDIKVSEDWTNLDMGWIGNPSFLILQNLAGEGLATIPTPEKRRDIDSKIIEVGINTDYENSPVISMISILPREIAAFTPSNSNNIYVRCINGETKLRVNTFPK